MRFIRVLIACAFLVPAMPALASDPPPTPSDNAARAAAAPANPDAAVAAPAGVDPAKPAAASAGAATAEPAAGALMLRLEELEQQIADMRAQIDDQKKQKEEEAARVDKLETKAALDRLNITGDVRIASDSLNGSQPAHFDGMKLQKGVVDSMFFMQTNRGAFPMPGNPSDPSSIYAMLSNNVAAHYADYLQFTNSLKFGDLKAAMAGFPAAQQMALMQMLMPGTYVSKQDYQNNILYTTRVRLNLRTEISEHMSFSGRLAMYKAWGDSSGVQVFNGQPTSINVDGITTGVPNSDIVRVDRAYFDWNSIGDTGLYFSLGRRPSSGGPPTEIREGRLRGGTPLGHVVDYQFDGITVGYAFKEKMPGAIWRFCYGLGYESGFGNADQLQSPSNRLKDVHFGGFNLDLFSSDRTFVQATVLRAFNVTDGFNSLVVLPVDPVTGNSVNAPVVMRYTPSANLGNIDLQAVAMTRNDGPVKWFASFAGMQTHPDNVTTPFGGLMTDPFSTPASHTAWSVYTGARFDLPNGKTQFGAEFNRGSKYWFNFTQDADEILLSKLATRGNVIEAYWNQQFGSFTQVRVSGMQYYYEYSGSGWHVGEPKPLDQPSLLGFPTYKNMFNLRVSMTVRF